MNQIILPTAVARTGFTIFNYIAGNRDTIKLKTSANYSRDCIVIFTTDVAALKFRKQFDL